MTDKARERDLHLGYLDIHSVGSNTMSHSFLNII